MRELILDANVVLRFLVQDVPGQARAASKLLGRAENGEIRLIIDPLIIAETVYVLTSFYQRPREVVADALISFVQSEGIACSQATRVVDALRRFKRTSVDYADAWLAASGAESNCEIASFDRDLDRFNDIKRFDPEL
ncbi:MAG: PIN domain-containing protein [Verrucomicrobiales bacterium]|nr:PIN domain-containing protein [Verrucomicrobiales bacterium]